MLGWNHDELDWKLAEGEICTPEAFAVSYKDTPVVFLGSPALKMVEPKRIALSRTKALLAKQLQSLHSGTAPLKWMTICDNGNWSLNQELNPKPIPYEGIALPIVLLRRGAANGT